MRKPTRPLLIRDLSLGGGSPVRLQSMTLSRPREEAQAREEIATLAQAGSEIVRLAVVDASDLAPLSRLSATSPVPLVADIHFDADLALAALPLTDAVRVNPSNIGCEEALSRIIRRAQELKKPLRFGFNQGSLRHHGSDAAMDLVEAALAVEKLASSLSFTDYCLSVKTSSVASCIRAYEGLSRESEAPLHIGLTEAGTVEQGLVSSSIALGTLLREGIGDTIRVSLATEDRLKEIQAEKNLLSSLGLRDYPRLVACPNCGRRQCDTLPIAREIARFLTTLPPMKLTVAVMGCAVNGPGEAKDADLGIAGGVHDALLFAKGEVIRKVPEAEIIPALESAILDWVKEKQES